MYNALIKTLYGNTNTQYMIADDIIYQHLIQQDTTKGQTEEI